MRRLLALFILAASWLAASDVADLHPPSDALLVTSFNTGSALDRSWGQRTPTTGAGVTFPAGYRTADFDGGGTAGISYPDDAALEAVPMTVCAWIRIDTYSGVRQIVGKCTTATTYEGWIFYYGPGLTRGLSLLQIDSVIPVTTGYAAHWTNTSTLTAGAWYHVAFTLASLGATPVFYINGAAVSASGSAVLGTVVSFANSIPLKVGGLGSPDVTSYHDGGLDDVRIYSRVLTANEIGAIYAEGIGASRP